MILIDFSHLSMRCLFVAIEQAKKNGFAKKFTNEGKLDISCYKNFYLHLLFNNVGTTKKDFGKKYGPEIVLAIDAKSSWRKDFYAEYKGNRKEGRDKADVDFDQFYAVVEDAIKAIQENFPYKVVKVDKAEGDDIIAIICKNLSEKILVISEDKDFKQLLKYSHVTIYRPILKVFLSITKNELTTWKATHIIGGDSGDNVPTIKANTEFSPAFLKYLREQEIFETDVYKFNKLSISNKLYTDYNTLDKKGDKDIFKPARFGEKGIIEFIKDLRVNLKSKKLYWLNYNRNKKLVMFEYIPQNIQSQIIQTYNTVEISYNPLKIKSYFDNNELRYLSNNVQMFYSDNEITVKAGMFDWF